MPAKLNKSMPPLGPYTLSNAFFNVETFRVNSTSAVPLAQIVPALGVSLKGHYMNGH